MVEEGFGLVPAKKGRYRDVGQGSNRSWTRNEDHILRAVILSCRNEHDYLMGCLFLCKLLDRRPAYFSGSLAGRLYQRDVRRSEVIVGNRIWDMVTGYRDFKPDLIYQDFTREGRDLCYAEQAIFLPKYQRTKKANKPPLSHVATILGRRSTLEIEEWLQHPGVHEGTGTQGIAMGMGESYSQRIKDRFLKLCLDNPQDGDTIRVTWRELDKLYNG